MRQEVQNRDIFTIVANKVQLVITLARFSTQTEHPQSSANAQNKWHRQ